MYKTFTDFQHHMSSSFILNRKLSSVCSFRQNQQMKGSNNAQLTLPTNKRHSNRNLKTYSNSNIVCKKLK